MKTQWIVSYRGIFGPVILAFLTKVRAEQWARQAGVYMRATITKQRGGR